MNIKRFHVLLSVCLLFGIASVVFAGGWAIITLKEFPDYAVAGKTLNLTFAVRQHGVTLLPDLHPTVRATTAAGLVATAAVTPGATRGEYTSALILPEPGEWTITINSGFLDNATTFPTLRVISSTTTAPAPFSPATRGVRLFTAKGCIGCHRHIEVNPEHTTDSRFDLTTKRFPPEYLRQFLADPSLKTKDMPNLKLKDDEIEALAAFINKGVMKQAPAK